MAPDPRKINAITNWPVPDDLTKVRQILGLASYYRRYIYGFADIARPLSALTKKGAVFEWTSQCSEAFETLKKQFCHTPVLAYPQFHKGESQFIVQTDASGGGLGAVLEQNNHAVAYAS